MRYLPYLLLLVSFALGYVGYPVLTVLIVALLSAFLLFGPRRRQLREQPQAPDQNMLLDGAFLFVQQALIHIVAGALGVFMARMMGG